MKTIKPWQHLYLGAVIVAFLAAFGLWNPFAEEASAAKHKAPGFKVDPSWPKRLPNNWLMGQIAGIAVDKDDNIWIVQRPRSLTSDEAGATDALPGTTPPADAFGNARPAGSLADCCYPAPSVLQLDKKGNLLRAWGGPAEGFGDSAWNWPANTCIAPECEWPVNEHGIYVDHNMNVYIAGNAGGDAQVVKFAADGTFLLQIGDEAVINMGSNDTNGCRGGTPCLYRPADMEVDPKTNELYIADGYGNHRIVVVDADTGFYKRHWGAYGQKPVDDGASDAMGPNDNPAAGTDPEDFAPPHFRNPVHAVRISKDGLVYVADRPNNRVQVFDMSAGAADCIPAGPGSCGFLGEKFVERDTLGPGSVWDLDTSADKRQTFLFIPDGTNQYVWELLRSSLDILARFGGNGRHAGQFHWVHNLAVDSKGNMYTAEVDTGKRAQKFKSVGKRKDNGGEDDDTDDSDGS
ncbi:MAG: hypothetical protein OES46_11230 [Gammaproteobacteria bacterium]|jgi:hypothetical protein|nr:hypothetical protein [Gammaproteobacteria bacterium]